jgi:uncharacterized protein (DUF488 family)
LSVPSFVVRGAGRPTSQGPGCSSLFQRWALAGKALILRGIGYLSLPELGNPFLREEDWKERYPEHLRQGGDQLLEGLWRAERPFCLMCAEKRAQDCHRKMIADALVAKGGRAVHIE